ncbi:hypothetical protein GCM10027048_12930 [Hymenobacter coalescens]
MKKTILTATILCYGSLAALAQNEEEVKLDVLRAPVSPASNLLGIATTDIDKPTDVSAFMLSLQSASNSFSKLPSNYAVDLAPYYLLPKERGDFTTQGLKSPSFNDTFKQTLIISAAVRNPDATEGDFSANNTYTGLGVKFSILRGEYDEATTVNLDKIIRLQKRMVNELSVATQEWITKNDPYYIQLVNKRAELFLDKSKTPKQIQESPEFKVITNELSTILANVTAEQTQKTRDAIAAELQTIAANFQTNRVGFSWDVNGGISGEFIDKRFNKSRVYNAGLWTNFGYTTKNGMAFLGLVRYLYNPDKVFALDNQSMRIDNISTLDGGLRLAYSKSQSKFSGSAEGIYRSVLSSDTIDPSWRLVLNADYAIFQNQKLTFSFGRNFDGTVSKDGNLIAALTFLAGFGNKR